MSSTFWAVKKQVVVWKYSQSIEERARSFDLPLSSLPKLTSTIWIFLVISDDNSVTYCTNYCANLQYTYAGMESEFSSIAPGARRDEIPDPLSFPAGSFSQTRNSELIPHTFSPTGTYSRTLPPSSDATAPTRSRPPRDKGPSRTSRSGALVFISLLFTPLTYSRS